MIDKLKYFAKLSSVAVLTLVKIYALAFVSTCITFSIGLVHLINNSIGPSAGHLNGFALIVIIVTTHPLQSLLVVLIMVCFALLIAAAHKYVISKVISRIVADKSETLINPILDKVITKFRTGQPKTIKSGADFAMVKLQLIQNIQKESDNKWAKKAVVFGLKKIKLDDVNLNQPDLDVYEIIKIKAIAALKDVTAPSKNTIWILITLQWIFALVLYFL